jgi:type IV pilus assembly protein PilM
MRRKIGEREKPSQRKKDKNIGAKVKGKLCFAFDFGEYATKVVVAKIDKGKIGIRHMLVIENDQREAKIDNANLKDWKTKISRAFNQNNISSSGQIGLCMVNSHNYISRQLDIPYAEETDRQGLVAYEMSQRLSLDMETHLFQHKVLRTYENDGVKMCTVWAAAVSKDLCELYFQLLESLKLQPLIMDVSVNGIERLFSMDRSFRELASDSTVVTVDYGIHGTEVNIYEQGHYLQGAYVERGDGKLVAAAKNMLGVQIADIHNGNKLIIPPQKVYEIMTKADQSEMAQLFLTTVEEWLSDINGVVKRYNVTYPAKPIARILLYGGSPQLVWLRAYLEKYLRIPTTVIQTSELFHPSEKIAPAGNAIPQFLNAMNLLLIR